VLKGAADLYGGVIVDAESLPSDTTLFSSMLLRSLEVGNDTQMLLDMRCRCWLVGVSK
jgi:hypothetical protein